MSRTVYLVDRTTTAKPSALWLGSMARALRLSLMQFSVDWHFAHVWTVEIVRPGKALPGVIVPGSFPIVLVDEEKDVPGALGYHFTNPDGTPAAHVMTKTILDGGGTWASGANSVSVCVDHEAKETVLDMAANSYAFDWHGRAWAIEACDAVQSSTIPGPDGITLSNYVLPSYFTPGSTAIVDKLAKLRLPFSIDRGGYAIVADYRNERQAFGTYPDLQTMGFGLAPDPDGRGMIIFDPELPPFVRAMKLGATSRTMRRLEREKIS